MKKLKFLLTIFLICFSMTIWAQKKVSGTVTDSGGDPLPGASIVEKGTANGTVSDFNGTYSIQTNSDNTTLSVSYLGFETVEKIVTPSR